MDYEKEIWSNIEKAAYLKNETVVFTDWIDLILNSLLALTDNAVKDENNFLTIQKLIKNKLTGEYENRYIEIAKKYDNYIPTDKSKKTIHYLIQSWGLLSVGTTIEKRDILGAIYEQKISHGRNGQFFTPDNVVNCMSETVVDKDKNSICDPCCGSGRFLIGAGQINKQATLLGIDIDESCAKMTVLNMFMFDFNSVVYCGDTLNGKMKKKWVTKKGGFIFEMPGKDLPIQKLEFDNVSNKKQGRLFDI